MTPDLIKHKIRPQDDLASLASRIGMPEEELKEFHNRNCGKMDKVWFTNLKGVDFILIPTLYISKEEQEIRNEKMLPSKEYFSGFHASKYFVSEIFEEPNKENLNFNYFVNLNIQNSKDDFIVETSLEDCTKNKAIPDDKISSLSLACMKNLYPISYKISQKGKLEACFNHQNLIEQFKNKRSELKDFFIGDISKSYMDFFAEKLSDENYFFKQMKSGLLHQTLFPNLEWFHKHQDWMEEFFIYSNSFPLQFTCRAEQNFDDSDFVETKMFGTLSENCSLRELMKGFRMDDEDVEENVDVEIEIQYFTHKVTRQLHEVKSSVSIWHQNELFQKHRLHLTQN